MHIRKIDHALTLYQQLCTARQHLLSVLHEWLSAGPGREAADAEVTATVAAIQQIATLLGATP